MNLFLTIIKSLLLVFITVAALQIGSVYLLRFLQPELMSADLVSIMPISKDRIANGCMAAADPGAAHLMLINNDLQGIDDFDLMVTVMTMPGMTGDVFQTLTVFYSP